MSNKVLVVCRRRHEAIEELTGEGYDVKRMFLVDRPTLFPASGVTFEGIHVMPNSPAEVIRIAHDRFPGPNVARDDLPQLADA